MSFIVAEIGVNWNGDFQIAKKMIKNAKQVGFNAVKFQAFNQEIIRDHPQQKELLKTSISEKNIEKINNICKEIGIEWFCTPMFPDAVELLDPFVNKFKIRMADSKRIIDNKKSEILERILKTKKDVIISSQESPSRCKYYNHEKIKWLYVVPKYPCKLSDLNFKNFNQFNGYSNHCPNIIAPLIALILKAEIIEVHVTLDKSGKYFDNNVSFDFVESKKLVVKIKQIKKII